MPVEKSAGAVVFHRDGGKIEYLILQARRGSKNWGFPKGMIEKNENLEEAALREVSEETGLRDLIFVNGFKETIRYFMKVKFEYQLARGLKMGQTVLKFVTYFLAESKTEDVKTSSEHEDFFWLESEEAFKKLTQKESKEILKKANEFLSMQKA